MSLSVDELVASLETRGQELAALLEYAPRAFVMEFAGTPKSGKSTTVEAVRHFFSRHGFRVHVLAERAALCPIPMKGHLFFNTWCAASMLAELLANVETETDIIIVDRGLFDALVWLIMQEKRGELTSSEARTIESFLLLERWRTLIDLAIVMNVSAGEALTRENNQRLTQKGGSIMNSEVLSAIAGSVDEAATKFKPKFKAVIKHETTGHPFRQSTAHLVSEILDCFEAFVDPEILVVPREYLEALPLENGGSFGTTAIETAFVCVSENHQFMRRSEAEKQSEFVQIIPCGLVTYESRIFVFQRKDKDPKSRLYGKATMWQRCHVAKGTIESVPELLRSALMERISRLLFLSRVFPVEPLGYCWDREDSNSSRHFGIVHQIRIDNPHTAIDLKRKEFRKQRGHGLIGEFHDWKYLREKQDQLVLESWSRAILEGVKVEM